MINCEGSGPAYGRAMDILVVGAGVAGLTTAVTLAEAGHRVRVRTRERPEETTSAVAGAVWSAYLTEPGDRARRWAHQTRAVLTDLAGQPGTGVHVGTGIEVSGTTATPPAGVPADPLRPDELPGGCVTGWRFTVPLVDMPVYLAYLGHRLTAAAGTVELGEVTSLARAAGEADVLVNCTGAGARGLAGDAELVPVRGQIVVVDNPGVEQFFIEDAAELTYLLPHADRLVLGGTAQPGRDDRVPDPATAAAILRRCTAVEPRVAGARIREHRVGVRPSRPTVRLEREGTVIHHYGHGGAGVTLSWGCAEDVLELVRGWPAAPGEPRP
jgi:D-amino-acid oxidase